ncbi:hypothetical protein [Helicobacter pylori]|uniref:hypothetical protein n=1 Tax=Helicobacter pylori TaxID=210 RepID=UPI001F408FD0|nr:hypothetical protein [Helicobacter pylori]
MRSFCDYLSTSIGGFYHWTWQNQFLVTQDNDSKLITGLKVKPIYIKAEIDKADIIRSFIPQARTLKE